MASFQVEIASTSTFGCMMRKHSHPERCTSGGSTSFPENLKNLVHSCISGDPRNSDVHSDENVSQIVDLDDLWVHKPQYLANSNQNIAEKNNQQIAEKKSPQKQSPKNRVPKTESQKTESQNCKVSDNWDKARKKVFSGEKKEDDNDGLVGESSETPRVVSSLVQKWRDLSEAKTLQSNNNNSSACSTRTNSGIPENIELPPAISVAAGDDSSDATDSPSNNESFLDWESDRRATSAPPSVRGRDSDATESERVRVIDIIKKLTSSGAGDENLDREHNNNVAINEAPPLPRLKISAEQGCFCPLFNSPRIIRGRQAFTDLLVQMERERARELEGLTERKSVSKFQQKGRIQAMLKLKFLRRSAELKDVKNNAPSSCMSPASIRSTQSSIMHLREKFKTVVQRGLADSKARSKEVANNNNSESKIVSTSNDSISHNKEEVENALTTRNVSTSRQLKEENLLREVVEKIRTQTKEEISIQETDTSNQCKDIEGNSFKSDQLKVCLNCQQTNSDVQQVISSKNSNEGERMQRVSFEVTRENELTESTETTKFVSKSDNIESADKEERNNIEWRRKWEENDWSWVKDYSHAHSGWDQMPFDFQHEDFHQRVDEVISQDWINDVSRPRSEWEDLRQARYQEMLDPFFNNDVQFLLQRKSVSSFLTGDMRDKIDQLMISRSQKQLSPKKQLEEQLAKNKGIKVEEVVLGNVEGKTYREDEEEGDGNDYNQECDIRDEYDHPVASTSLSQFQSSNFFSRINEMKFMHEMMGHMEQLHQEMSEMRSAIVSCIDMQMKLQDSIKNEVTSAFNQLGEKSGMFSSKSKRNCSICHEMLVDSLLYRCGHMCTCFKCAQELQWSEGKCPTCQAPIVDVVRAYADA